ncbi:MAG: hypothetical protein ACXVP4_03220 [Bacteroidia bacterium]
MEIASLRTQQDVAKGNDKLKICEEQKKLYFKNPRNPDLYYLSCRCQGTDAQKDSAFFEGHKKWPENGWLAYASGFTYEQQEKWEDALSCFDTVFKYVPALRISITTEIKRISKLVGKDFSIASADLVDPYLTSVAEVEDSYEGDQKNKLYAFKLLEEGKLEDALNYCNTDTTLYGDLIRLAAVSEGATPSIIDKAIALKNNKINQLTIIPAVAFTIKRHLPLTADLKDVLKISFDDKVDTVYQFIDLISKNKIAEAGKLIKLANAEQVGKMSLLGVLLLGEKAPETWKLYADKLLFITEKPYLGLQSKEVAIRR